MSLSKIKPIISVGRYYKSIKCEMKNDSALINDQKLHISCNNNSDESCQHH